MTKKIPPGTAARRLLGWYDRHRRVLPWRAAPGEAADPYRVWLSEIMLQQTTVKTVEPYFHDFVRRWATVEALAAADLDAVLHAWQGLGYYARARNLHRCARRVADEHGGRLPGDEAALRALPGIGAYTAAAIAAIAFGRRAVVVDGNVERVMARLYAVAAPLPGAKGQLRDLAGGLTPGSRPGDYAQAVMDLGATICTPRNPRCGDCPWAGFCAARAAGTAETLPLRAPRRKRPVRRGVVFWLENGDGAVLLRRRAEEGLLGGMMEVPTTDWREQDWTAADAGGYAPAAAEWRTLPGLVRHTFTHFHLELTVMAGRLGEAGERGAAAPRAGAAGAGGSAGVWCPVDRLSEHALPSLMKKVAAHALRRPGQRGSS